MVVFSLDVIGVGEVCIDWIVKVKEFPLVDEKVFPSIHGSFLAELQPILLLPLLGLVGRLALLAVLAGIIMVKL